MSTGRRLFLCLCCVSSFLSLPAGSIPFTRGRNEQKEEQDNSDVVILRSASVLADAVIENGEIRGIRVSTKTKEGSRRNKVVDSFFQQGDDATAATISSSRSSRSQELKQEISSRAAELQEFMVTTRRALHRHPELMYNEKETSAYVQSVLRELDIDFSIGWAINTHTTKMPGPGGYGVVADIGTGGPPCVLLRADMDALPLLERTEGVDDFKSLHDGKMHACGHDGHTTMLLGAAAILKEMEESINGTVRLMFQPAEEGGAGAKRMREEGVLEKEPKPQHAFGMHVWPT
jgi:hypothetical protein